MRNTTLTILASLALAGVAGAQSPVQLTARSDSKLSVDGTSNLHAWSCKATSIEASLVVDPGYAKAETTALQQEIKRVDVKVPVGNLKCGHGKMDDNMYKALKAQDEPQIHYILGSFEVVPGAGRDEFTLKTVGTLTVAGVNNTVKMDVIAHRLADGSLRAEGQLPILMTDYGIKPPTAIFGTLKTGNQVTVKFDLLVAPQSNVAAAQP